MIHHLRQALLAGTAILLVACSSSKSSPAKGDAGDALSLPDADASPARSDGADVSPSQGDGAVATLPAGNHRVSFSIAPSTADVPVAGIDLTVRLPDGVQVATETDGSGRIAGTALASGGSLGPSAFLLGKYQATSRDVRLFMTTATLAAWQGEFARLTISVPAGTTLTQSSLLQAVGEPYVAYQAVGISKATRSTVDLAKQVKVKVALLD